MAMHEFNCGWSTPHPQGWKGPVGYLTTFNGLGLASELAADLHVTAPYAGEMAPQYAAAVPSQRKVSVVGILDSVQWNGGLDDPFHVSCYMSFRNADRLQQRRSAGLTSTLIDSVAWWVANYDHPTARWYEQHYPEAPAVLTGLLYNDPTRGVSLHVAGSSQRAPSVDADLYHVDFEIVPARDTEATFLLATLPTQSTLYSWGVASQSELGTINKIGAGRLTVNLKRPISGVIPNIILTPQWSAAVGSVSTVVEITDQHFVIDSANHGSDYWVQWIAHWDEVDLRKALKSI